MTQSSESMRSAVDGDGDSATKASPPVLNVDANQNIQPMADVDAARADMLSTAAQLDGVYARAVQPLPPVSSTSHVSHRCMELPMISEEQLPRRGLSDDGDSSQSHERDTSPAHDDTSTDDEPVANVPRTTSLQEDDYRLPADSLIRHKRASSAEDNAAALGSGTPSAGGTVRMRHDRAERLRRLQQHTGSSPRAISQIVEPSAVPTDADRRLHYGDFAHELEESATASPKHRYQQSADASTAGNYDDSQRRQAAFDRSKSSPAINLLGMRARFKDDNSSGGSKRCAVPLPSALPPVGPHQMAWPRYAALGHKRSGGGAAQAGTARSASSAAESANRPHGHKEHPVRRSGSIFSFPWNQKSIKRKLPTSASVGRSAGAELRRHIAPHTFIDVAFSLGSDNVPCDACDKPLGAKAGGRHVYQCDSCEIMVHQGCRELAAPCTKSQQCAAHPRPAVPMADGWRFQSPPGAVGETDTAAAGSKLPRPGLFELPVQTPATLISFPPLVREEWADLKLFETMPEPASRLFRDNELKLQHVLYDLYKQERQLCDNLVVLRQIYFDGIRERALLPVDKLASLLPDVFDSLFAFHVPLLRRLAELKCDTTQAFDKQRVYDLLLHAFDSGSAECQAAIAAHVKLGSQFSDPEEMQRYYRDALAQHQEFAAFIEVAESRSVPGMREHTLPAVMSKVRLHVTRYSLFMDSLCKYDHSAECNTVAELVRRFPIAVDAGITSEYYTKRWVELKARLDYTGATTLQGTPFTMTHLAGCAERRLRYAGAVQWSSATKKLPTVEMLLFDDLIVFMKQHAGLYTFHAQDGHEPVLPLAHVGLREAAGRGSSGLFLVVMRPAQPDMYDVRFSGKQRDQWLRQLHAAKENAVPVRYTPPDDIREETRKTSFFGPANRATDDFAAQIAQWDQWTHSLTHLFDERRSNEFRLKDYLKERLQWFDQLVAHLQSMPPGADGTADREQAFQVVTDALDTGFRRVDEQHRATVEQCNRRAESVFRGALGDRLRRIFDDTFDPADRGTGTSSSSDECDSGASANSGGKPKRYDTYHGEADAAGVQRPRRSADVRRHTTVPRRLRHGDTDSADTRSIATPAKHIVSRANRWLAKENALLYDQNNILRAECSRLSSELAAERAKCSAAVARADKLAAEKAASEQAKRHTALTLEQVRQAQAELQNRQTKLRDDEERMHQRFDEQKSKLKDREAKISADEQEIMLKWKSWYDKCGTPQSSASNTLAMRRASDELSQSPQQPPPLPPKPHNFTYMHNDHDRSHDEAEMTADMRRASAPTQVPTGIVQRNSARGTPGDSKSMRNSIGAVLPMTPPMSGLSMPAEATIFDDTNGELNDEEEVPDEPVEPPPVPPKQGGRNSVERIHSAPDIAGVSSSSPAASSNGVSHSASASGSSAGSRLSSKLLAPSVYGRSAQAASVGLMLAQATADRHQHKGRSAATMAPAAPRSPAASPPQQLIPKQLAGKTKANKKR